MGSVVHAFNTHKWKEGARYSNIIAFGVARQENGELKASLGSIARPALKNKEASEKKQKKKGKATGYGNANL